MSQEVEHAIPPDKQISAFRYRWIAMAAGLIGVAIAAYFLTAEESLAVVVGNKVPANNRVSFEEIDHSEWSKLLGDYVDEEGLVDYRSWHAASEDVARLDEYLSLLSAADPGREASRESQLAFWINAYNAVTVKGILREYPTDSIRNHTPVVGYNIWKHLLLQVGDEQFSLDDIEHKILRPMDEPRIHFAIVCASIGCPSLLDQAYVPESLDEQLTTNAEHFFAQERNFRFDASSNTIYLSEILKWFGEDFGDDQVSQLAAIATFLPNDEARRVANAADVTVKFIDYDWKLNEQPPQ